MDIGAKFCSQIVAEGDWWEIWFMMKVGLVKGVDGEEGDGNRVYRMP